MLQRGERLTELLKQRQDDVMKLSEQVAVLLSFSEGLFKDIELNKIKAYEKSILEYLKKSCPNTLAAIDESGELTDEDKEILTSMMKLFDEKRKENQDAERN